MPRGRVARDRVDEKFARLTIVGRIKGGYLCRCDCGNIKEIADPNWGVTQSCGCARKLPSGMASRNATLRSYKRDAKYRNLTWLLTEQEFDRLTGSNCYYCGEFPSNRHTSDYRSGDFIYNGIDRIDNNRGYESDNVVPCCFRCNEMKHTYTMSEFVAHARKVVEFQTSVSL